MPIRHGTKGSKEEGGSRHSGGDGARIHNVKNDGTADPAIGGLNPPRTSKSGLNIVKGGK